MKKIVYINLLIFLIFCLPTQASIVVLSGLSTRISTEKGQTYKGSIEVQNTGKTTKNVRIYLQDMYTSEDGNSQYVEPGSTKSSNSNWIKFNTNLIELKPGEKNEFKYEITVPNHINTPGSYWSTCMVEPIEEIVPNTKEGINIRSIIRYAVQIITDYEVQTSNVKLQFKNIKIESSQAKKILLINLENTGNSYCRVNVNAEIYNQKDGEKINGDFNSATMGLYPESKKFFSIDISSLAIGKYKVIAFAKDENDNIFALEFEINIE